MIDAFLDNTQGLKARDSGIIQAASDLVLIRACLWHLLGYDEDIAVPEDAVITIL